VKSIQAANPELPPNSVSAVEARTAAGKIGWAGPVILLTTRMVLALLIQSALGLAFRLRGSPSAMRAAGGWWMVYGTLIDLTCLGGLLYFTRREGIRVRDLIGPIRLRWGRDFWLGLGYFLLIFPVFFGSSMGARYLLSGPGNNALNQYLLRVHALPVAATVYTLSMWWLVWSPTEEITYQAYVLPRLRALTGRPRLAFLIVAFFFAGQHCMMPFVADWRYIVFRFLSFLPGCMLLIAAYLRTRRVAPLVFAQWPMDIAAAVITAVYSS
jgi:hypothetical protein